MRDYRNPGENNQQKLCYFLCWVHNLQKNPFSYDIVITDLNMPFMNGIELLKNIHLQNPDQAVMVVSAHNETEYFLESIRNNITGYILKWNFEGESRLLIFGKYEEL